MAVRTLAGCVAELFGPAASPAPPANGSRCSETAALCPISPGRYCVDLEAISPTRARRPFLRAPWYQSEYTDVFLSLHLALNSMGAGLNVFNQIRDLAKADVNKEIMQEHARNSKVVLALLSPNYFNSKWCRYELIAAQEAGVPIVPVYSGFKDSYPALLQLNDELREDAEKGPAVKAAFAEKGITITGEGVLDGPTIDEKKLIDNHYYAIANKVLGAQMPLRRP